MFIKTRKGFIKKSCLLVFCFIALFSGCKLGTGEVYSPLDNPDKKTEEDEKKVSTYKVEHYLQTVSLESYEIVKADTKEYEGLINSKTEAKANSYPGFYAKDFEQTSILKNGKTLVKIYYDRKNVNFTFNLDGGTTSTQLENDVLQGLYGTNVVIFPPEKIGYTFKKWDPELPQTFTFEDASFTAIYEAGSGIPYKAQHYIQNKTMDGYELFVDFYGCDSDSYIGVSGELTNAQVKEVFEDDCEEYNYFTAKPFEQIPIAGDGSTIVNIYYDRNPITVNFESNGGNGQMDTQTFYCGATQKINKNLFTAPASKPYFCGWNTEVNGTGSFYLNGDTAEFISDCTLYARWRESNGGLVGTANNGVKPGDMAKESYMDSNGNLQIDGKAYSYTSENIVIPSGTYAAIDIKEVAQGKCFTTTRKVKITPFVMSQYEVTNELFNKIMGSTYYPEWRHTFGAGSQPIGYSNYNPVVRISHIEAVIFCNLLSLKEGLDPVYYYEIDGQKLFKPDDWLKNKKLGNGSYPPLVQKIDIPDNIDNWWNVKADISKNGYRLPTEAEWEYAARGGDPNSDEWFYKYSGSNNIADVAWYAGNCTGGDEGTHEVGKKKPNSLGLYDMTGNVWEYCTDRKLYDQYYDDNSFMDSKGYIVNPYLFSSPVNKDGSRYGDCFIYKGGSYIENERRCCTSEYDFLRFISYGRAIGFRLCRTISE